jgi:hypothetical protein
MDFVQIKLERCGSFSRLCITRLNLTEDFSLVAKQDDTPAVLLLPFHLVQNWREFDHIAMGLL